MSISIRSIFLMLAAIVALCPLALPQTGVRSVLDLYKEVDTFEAEQRKVLAGKGKRYDSSARADILGDRRSLAKKYGAEIASRPDLKESDFYYLARLYSIAGDDRRTLETMRKYLSQFPQDTVGAMIQSALSYVIVLSSAKREMDVAEEALARWLKGKPLVVTQQPALQDYIATGYFKDGKYDEAIRHAQSAFDLLKNFQAKNSSEKRDREQIYMNLVEVLALGYKKSKNSEQALSILANARAESFAIPSANLYRKVMDFVEGSGFSEKKLMQKVESIPMADAAPEMKFSEWVGGEPLGFEEFRGKVVLLDFWATWCGPCIATFPRLRGWHKKFAGEDFIIVGVTQYYGEQEGKKMTNLQELEYIKAFKAKHKLPYSFALIGPTDATLKYGISAYPTTVLLDRSGVVRYIGIGSRYEESENLEDMIKKVLKEEAQIAISK